MYAFVIAVSILVTGFVLWPHIKEWIKNFLSKSSKNKKSVTYVDVSSAIPPVENLPKYLGNSNTMEIHDLNNLKPACQIERMNEEHKVFFYTLEEVEEAIKDQKYDGCKWCMNQYHTD